MNVFLPTRLGHEVVETFYLESCIVEAKTIGIESAIVGNERVAIGHVGHTLSHIDHIRICRHVGNDPAEGEQGKNHYGQSTQHSQKIYSFLRVICAPNMYTLCAKIQKKSALHQYNADFFIQNKKILYSATSVKRLKATIFSSLFC